MIATDVQLAEHDDRRIHARMDEYGITESEYQEMLRRVLDTPYALD